MRIEVDVTREFIVNGKQYRSLEEVPAEYRRAIQGTLGSPLGNSHAGTYSEIIVNGKRYRDENVMPEGVREIYEAALQCLGPVGGGPAAGPPAHPKPVVPSGSPPGRWLMLGGLLFCLLVSLLLLLLPR